jgi:hypothetical protein
MRFAATAAAGAAMVAATAVALRLMGRLYTCACGTVRIWYGPKTGQETSQQFADWYSLSHVNHGFIFYGLFWLFLRRVPLQAKLLLAIAIECGWELFENSSFIIDRYRATTVSFDYYGDSILNSVGDIAAMVLGFIIAARLPPWLTIALAVGFEVLAAYMIRDNLTLNVIMLLWPLDQILQWQQGA